MKGAGNLYKVIKECVGNAMDDYNEELEAKLNEIRNLIVEGKDVEAIDMIDAVIKVATYR